MLQNPIAYAYMEEKVEIYKRKEEKLA